MKLRMSRPLVVGWQVLRRKNKASCPKKSRCSIKETSADTVPKTLVTNTPADVEKPTANGAADNLTINNPARVNESSANVAPKTLAVDSPAGVNNLLPTQLLII
jgi:hypothetical protein